MGRYSRGEDQQSEQECFHDLVSFPDRGRITKTAHGARLKAVVWRENGPVAHICAFHGLAKWFETADRSRRRKRNNTTAVPRAAKAIDVGSGTEFR